ncbi:anchored repeat-type ABC transporter permease subunit [Actinotignum urinale]|uniref:anchored repeat-type ABC transporter permease subunit n=1 Tax=Actinotignum urinale TaxID=190146 RepID=UPI002A8143F8|nr:anchored repeat-type ABC transporter permease subunit [Actinotignum urinale]MDY5151842.1 anchored repeat-type ABC transporter permease subunit [Actinotignum urinale]
MISFFDFLQDLTNPALHFLPRALVGALIAAVLCSLVGVHVVLRGLGFVGDALAHAVFPGIAIAFATCSSILVGGFVSGIIVAIIIALSTHIRRIGADSFIGIFFAAAFALGLVIIARVPGYSGSLESFLFGSLTGISDADIYTSALGSLAVIIALALIHPSLVSVCVDREFATSRGTRVILVDAILYVLIAVTVVVSVHIVGNILVVALLITPASTARLFTDNLRVMQCLSPVLGAVCAFFGVYFSWALNIPTGASIVLVATTIFLASVAVAPKGVLSRLRGKN